jgi:O-antigen ligase
LVLLLGLQAALTLWVNDWLFVGLCLGLFAAVVSLIHQRNLWYLGIFTFPLSINLEQYIENSIGISVPSDLLAIGLLLLLLLSLRRHLPAWGHALSHPLSRAVLLWLTWMLFTGFTSAQPVVSFKYFLSALWFAGAFYFGSLLFLRRELEIDRWLVLLIPSLVFVALFTVVKHAAEGFSFRSSFTIMQPFYKEHTAYAASLAIPFVIYLVLWLRGESLGRWGRAALVVAVAVLAVALVFSFTRGAWIGSLAAVVFFGLVELWRQWRLGFWGLCVLVVLGVGVLLQFNWSPKSKGDKRKGHQEHLKSVVDTESDLSNLERINRWVAAFNMMAERPLFGFGPGAYTFEYARFQESSFRTSVSTNQGKFGSAHSEYLLAATEQGLPGLLVLLLLYGTSLWVAVRGYLRAATRRHRSLYIALGCALVSYYVHGLVNNFMDQEKLAIPLHVCFATLTALDIYHSRRSS